MSHVDLGYSQECEPWQVASNKFPSKIGGKPAWLDLENLPQAGNLQCDNCHNPLIFLCQVKAECCVRNSSSNIIAFRSSLPRYNKFYSSEPPDDNKEELDFSLSKFINLCSLCGCLGEKKCSKCKKKNYCSREHQVIDWKEGHKSECETYDSEGLPQRLSSQLFSQFELVIEAEELSEKIVDENEELEKFHQLKLEGKTGTMNDISDEDIEKYAICQSDKVFTRFKKQIEDNPEQVLRYERGGQPLWIAADPKPESIPNCEYCGEARQFEFQIMPQLLSVLHENELDIGIICVYTCVKSCVGGDNYKKEFVFKQDVALTS